jgi:hypothetical protein
MGWFTRNQQRDAAAPTLAEAWETLGHRLGLEVVAGDERAVRAHGIIRNRPVSVEIRGSQRGSELLSGMGPTRRKRVHQRWTTELTVGCRNPAGLEGVLESVTDIHDPEWDPRNFDPSHCRIVRSDPPELAGRIITPSIHERLMGLETDNRIEVRSGDVRVAADTTTGPDVGFIAGSPIHLYPGPPQPWPDRALAGPPWWIDLLCDIADAVDR